MNREFAERTPGDSTLAARVRSYEMAAKMQLDVPGIVNLESETAETKRLYGLDDKVTEGFGRMEVPNPGQLMKELECQGIMVGQNFVCPRLAALTGFVGDLVGVGRVAALT